MMPFSLHRSRDWITWRSLVRPESLFSFSLGGICRVPVWP